METPLEPPPPRRLLAGLFLVSFALRLGLALWVIAADMPVRGDEGGYVRRAVVAERALDQLAEGKGLTLEDVDRWYGGGRWGPLYPLVLAVGFQFTDDTVPTARILVAVVGALTTPLVFLLTRRFAGQRAAWIAAGLHLVYGGFVAFSHLLWSETFFLFPLLLSVHLANGVTQDGAHNLRRALGAGVAMGLAGLIRPTILPFLGLFPLWLFFRLSVRPQRLAVPALFLAGALTTLAPWTAWQYAMEGHLVPLATTGSLNLFRANKAPDMSEAAVVRYARDQEMDLDCVMRELALREMKKDPVSVFGAGLHRTFRELWTPEKLPVGLLRRATYPPVSHVLLGGFLLLTLAVYLAIVTLGGIGFRLQITALGSIGTLLLLMVLSSLAFPMIMRGGNSRLVLVNLALMLPLAGYGWVHRHQWKQVRWKIPSTLAVLAMPISILSTLWIGTGPTTGYYAPLVSKWHGAIGKPVHVFDEFEFRGAFLETSDQIEISTADGRYWILETGTPSSHWNLTPDNQHQTLTIVSKDANEAVKLSLRSRNFAKEVMVEPLSADHWQTWRATGLPGIELRWRPWVKKPSFAKPVARGGTPAPAPVISVPECKDSA